LETTLAYLADDDEGLTEMVNRAFPEPLPNHELTQDQRPENTHHCGGCFFFQKSQLIFQVVLHPSVLARMKPYRATPSASTSSLPKLLTTTEVMPLLRVTTRGTLCAWVRAGKLPAIRMPDNSYCFDEAVIMAWLGSRKVSRGGA
jgi:excisionase family DNA binding protein